MNNATLKERASLLRAARQFFYERGLIEVDVPLLSERASVDAHIDLVPARYNSQKTCYLHSSPEYGMKRLLSEGSGDIFQLSHVFRDGELGQKHNPEFMMAEWYRVGRTFEELIEETLDFIRLFLGPLPAKKRTYRQTFEDFTGLTGDLASSEEILAYYEANEIPLYEELKGALDKKDELLTLLLSSEIEPMLGQNELYVLSHYPSTQAALAKTLPDGTAERFEIYYKGVELCNGYHELSDAAEQRSRLHQANEERVKLGKNTLPIDTLFLEALEKGLPDCVGVAVGFDRLLMLRLKAGSLADVIPFPFPLA